MLRAKNAYLRDKHKQTRQTNKQTLMQAERQAFRDRKAITSVDATSDMEIHFGVDAYAGSNGQEDEASK